HRLSHGVRERPVDAVLDRRVEDEAYARGARAHPEGHVVAQALRVEIAERALVAEVRVGLVGGSPGRAAIAPAAGGRDAVDQAEALHYAERGALPPAEYRRIEQDDRAEERRALQRGEGREIAAERMPHAEHGRALALDVLDQLLDQVRPAVGDRV